MLKSLPAQTLVGVEEQKKKEEFRNYTDSFRNDLVNYTYLQNHMNQTVQFVESMRAEYSKFQKAKMTLWQALERLDQVVDDSDPDTDNPQIYHAFQTAEALRKKYPDIEWLPLIGLIHDLGKILVLPEFGGLPQWATVGDNYPVGCAHSEKIVKHEFFQYNPDTANTTYNTLYGIYEPNCGLNNVLMSWGHDEYMYMVCKHNGALIPQMGLNLIRFHSFYPWHKEKAYEHLMSESDFETRKWAKRFSQCDLYSKAHEKHSPEEVEKILKPYYQSLIEKYFPSTILEW
jgi:inositol oxygenase